MMPIFTGPKLAVSLQAFRAPSTHVIARTISFVLFGSALAFMLTVSEYLLLANTSSITLAIVGIFKVRFATVLFITHRGSICLQIQDEKN